MLCILAGTAFPPSFTVYDEAHEEAPGGKLGGKMGAEKFRIWLDVLFLQCAVQKQTVEISTLLFSSHFRNNPFTEMGLMVNTKLMNWNYLNVLPELVP